MEILYFILLKSGLSVLLAIIQAVEKISFPIFAIFSGIIFSGSSVGWWRSGVDLVL